MEANMRIVFLIIRHRYFTRALLRGNYLGRSLQCGEKRKFK